MSDPFERVAASAPQPSPPDVRTIKARADAIRRRRQAAISGLGAAAVAVVAVVALFVLPPGEEASEVARVASPAATPGPVRQQLEEGTADLAGEAVSAEQSSGASATTLETAPVERGARSGVTSGGGGGGPASADGGAPQRAGTDALRAELVVEQGAARDDATFRLRVCNTSDREAVADFSDAQRYEFVVTRAGREVWRWSEGMAFAQVTGSERWAPEECRTNGWQGHWDGTDSSGRPVTGTVEATGILVSSPEVRSRTETVCLVTC